MTLWEGAKGREYLICRIRLEDRAFLSFLMTIGCFEGEKINIISKTWGGVVVAIKDGRYFLDRALSLSIEI